tara:strand:- start:11214 stop:11726 length:513 start_codon:yes stop_codon:yes gene_type:complete
MIKKFNGKEPKIHPTAFVSEFAYLIGDIEIGANSSIWPGVILRADSGKITIGDNTNIQDNSIVHGDEDVFIGNGVTMGHMVMCHATRVGDNVMLANASVINDGVNVGNNCLIGASSTVVPNMLIPDCSFVLGTPARIKSQISDKHLDMVKKNALSYVRRTKIYKKHGNFE